ncbi:hypothetical protein [Candidatus Lokiarchaeum ossiferum]|uniref:hypothetical protein n=1 Tax=Candidatus Lokiarchaeum ossiferum TaxID=2951803 RepID=UPI00352DCA09
MNKIPIQISSLPLGEISLIIIGAIILAIVIFAIIDYFNKKKRHEFSHNVNNEFDKEAKLEQMRATKKSKHMQNFNQLTSDSRP